MRELEFLPVWYPKVRRQRHRVVLQLWLTGAVFFGLGLWMVLSERNVRGAESTIHMLQGQVTQADDQLRKLGELESLKRQLSQQAEVVLTLGPHISTSRIIDILDETMPPGMALLDLTVDTQLQERAAPALAVASGKAAPLSRHVIISLHGVTPNDADLGDFVARLSNVPHFSDTAPVYSKDRIESGHLMREFQVHCTIDLTDDTN
jgi:Tfp pilus assembly protein PilN